jgi:ParB family chromosome partitioning protein
MSAHLPTQPPTPPAPATAAVETSKPTAAKTEEKKPVVSKVEPLKAIEQNGVAAHPAVTLAKDFFPAGPGASRPSDEFRNLPLDHVVPSATNPRKHFAGQELEELVASIRRSGVLVPILVRPRVATLGDYDRASAILRRIDSKVPKVGDLIFEIVAGERRYRAALKAGLEEIPARVKEMNDEQALEAQIVENLQRKDVAPIEEAHGYAVLLAQMAKGSKGEKAPSRQQLVEQLAQRLGKSVRYVYARMKLAELDGEVLKQLEAGAITAGHADEMVRLQPADQVRAIKFLFQHRQRDEGTRSTRELRKWISEEVQHDLSAAPWKKDDAKLVTAAGACATCEKRTGAHPELHPEVKAGKDFCLDPTCFDNKKSAFVQVQIKAVEEQHRAEVASTAVKAVDAKTLAKKKAAPDLNVLRISPASGQYDSELSPEDKKKAIFKGYDFEPGYVVCKPDACEYASPAVVVEGPEIGQRRTVCAVQQCKTHFRTREHGSYSSVSAVPSLKQKQAARRKKFAAELKLEIRRDLLRNVAIHAPSVAGLADLQLIARQMYGRLDHDRKRVVVPFLALESKKGKGGYGLDLDSCVEKKIAELASIKQMLGLLFVFAMAEQLQAENEYYKRDDAPLRELAKRLKVDVAGVEKNNAAVSAARLRKVEAKEAEAEKKKAAESKSAKAKTETKNKLGPEDRKKIAAGLREKWAAKKKGGRK